MDEDNIRILQDEFIDVLILERENVYHLFISAQTKTAKASIKPALVEAMKNEIKTLYKERFDLKKTGNLMKKIILKKETELQQLVEEISDLKDENVELSSKVSELEHELNNLKSVTYKSSIPVVNQLNSSENMYNHGNVYTQIVNEESNVNPYTQIIQDTQVDNNDINRNDNQELVLDSIGISDIGRKVNRELGEFLNELEIKHDEDNKVIESDKSNEFDKSNDKKKSEDLEISTLFDTEDFTFET
ncbi:MAG: hypothetical protein ACRCZI_02675 [Cetobacterium sp.]